MFTKGEINIGYIISTVAAVVIGGGILIFILKKRKEKEQPTIANIEEKTAE